MDNPCQPCKDFIRSTEQLFGTTLGKYGFTLADCYGEPSGRGSECQVMYRASIGQLLFVWQDGAAFCCLGTREATFPPFELLRGTGEYGWYYSIALAEAEAATRLVSDRMWRDFAKGDASSYEWEAALLAERAERLFAYLAATAPQIARQQLAEALDKQPTIW